jgi:hypothetical protein
VAEPTTTYERAVDRLRTAALEAAEREFGGELSDWTVTFEGPSHVVVKATRGPRFGTFAAQFGLADQSIRIESYGTRSAEGSQPRVSTDPAPLPATGAQAEAVARALDEWLAVADRDDDHSIAQREHVRAFRAALGLRSMTAEQARHDAEMLVRLLGDPHADDLRVRDLAGRLARFVHPRASRRFSRD